MRRLLFHGTHSYAAVKSIINSVDGHGFRPLISGSKVGAIWGDGSYFARILLRAQTLPRPCLSPYTTRDI